MVGGIIALGVAMLLLALFIAILNVANIIPPNTSPSIPPDIAHLVRMSAIQAGLTTLLSLGSGIAIAWALNRLHFIGRTMVVALFATAIVAPGMVVAFGMISVWGRAGWVANLAEIFGISWTGSVFGLGGILFAHTILNGAFAAHILLARLDAIPLRTLKTAQSLALSPLRRFTILDWPALSGALPGLGSIIFLLAFTSFPIVLMLGGGLSNQTLEVAIYAAVRLNFDLKGAVHLSVVQLVLSMLIILPALNSTPSLARAGSAAHYKWCEGKFTRLLQVLVLTLALLGFGLPLVAVLIDGFGPGLLSTLSRASFWQAAVTSTIIGSTSAVLTLLISLQVSMARTSFTAPLWRTIISAPFYAYLVIPAVVLSLGFYLGSRQLGLPTSSVAPFVLVFASTLLALPFALSVLAPPFEAINKRYAKLSRSLNMNSFNRWRLVEWPLMGREIGIVLALGFCFSLGDLGIISLFGTAEFTTLPWAMYQALGAYRTNDAAAIAALMLLLTFVVFWSLPRLFRRWCNVGS